MNKDLKDLLEAVRGIGDVIEKFDKAIEKESGEKALSEEQTIPEKVEAMHRDMSETEAFREMTLPLVKYLQEEQEKHCMPIIIVVTHEGADLFPCKRGFRVA